MEYLKEWFEYLEAKGKLSISWKETISVTGECHHSGPNIWFAVVNLEFSPRKQFEVNNTLSTDVLKFLQDRQPDRNWYTHIVFGVLDVMLTVPPTPLANFKLTIRDAIYNDIESHELAFRMAARNAAAKALRIHFPNSSFPKTLGFS